MQKLKLFLSIAVISTFSFGIVSINNFKNNNVNESSASDETANFGQLYDFLLTKEKHYTFVDAYVRQYQQESGGYIDYWKSQGGIVDKENCIPDQHWHFFESWCKPNIDAGSFKFTTTGSRGYSHFSCPELQLWIIEASGVSTDKVEEAYNVAIEGKKAGTAVNTICSNMRKIVPWDDINAQVLANLPENPNYHVSPAVDTKDAFTMSKFNYDGYQPGEKIEFTVTVNDSTKEIDLVAGTNVTISQSEGIYSFTMPSNHVDLAVTLKDKGGETPTIKEGYKLVTSLDELIEGARIIIGTPGSFRRNVAISTKQNDNNRSNITMEYDNGYYKISPDQDVQLCVFTISSVIHNEKKYYQFFDPVNKGYLYICSNNYNYLRTQAENNVNGYFEITNNSGVINIKASASNYSRNIIGNTASNFIGCGGGTVQTTVELSIYSDVSDTTKVWANSYVKMNDPSFEGEGIGLCKSEGLYTAAKTALIGMGQSYAYILKYSNDPDLSKACARYEAWAIANNDNDPYNGLIEFNSPLGEIYLSNILDSSAIIIISICICSMTLVVIFICVKTKKKTR